MGVRDALLLNTTGSNFQALQTDDTARLKGDLSLQKDDGTEVLGIDVSTATLNLTGGITGSGNISSSLSSTGSFGRVVATTFHGDGSALQNTLPRSVGIVTQSAQLAAQISGAFTSGFEMSASISGSATSTGSFGRLEGEFFFGDGSGIKTTLPRSTGLLTSSAQIASNISGSFNKGFEFSGDISGSATSTGSFGRLVATSFHGDASGIANSLPYPTGIISGSAQLASQISGSFTKGFEFDGTVCALPSAWLLSPEMVNGRHKMGGKGTFNAAIAAGGGIQNAPDHSEAGYVSHPSYFQRVCHTEEFNGISWSEVNDLNFGGPRGYGGTTEDGAALGAEHPESNNTEHWNGTNWSEGPAVDTGCNHRDASGGGCVPTKLYFIGGFDGGGGHRHVSSYNKDAGTFAAEQSVPSGWTPGAAHTGNADDLLIWGHTANSPTQFYNGTSWAQLPNSLFPDHSDSTGQAQLPGGGGRIFPHPYAHVPSYGAGVSSAQAGTSNDAYSYGGQGAYGTNVNKRCGNIAVAKHYNWDGTSWKYQGMIPTQGTGWTPGAKPPSPDLHGDVGPVVNYPAGAGHHFATGTGAGSADAFVFGGYYAYDPNAYPNHPSQYDYIISSGSYYYPEKSATLDVNLLSFISGSGDASPLQGVLYPGVLSGSAQIASRVSGSFTSGFDFDGQISGSLTSTGSFGRIESDFLHGDGSSIASSLPRSTGIVSGAAQIASHISGAFTAGFGYGGTIKTAPGGSWSTGGNLTRSTYLKSAGIAGTGTKNAALLAGGRGATETEEYDGTSYTEKNDLNDDKFIGVMTGTTEASIIYGGSNTHAVAGSSGCTEEWNGTNWTEVNDMTQARWRHQKLGITSEAAKAVGGEKSSPTTTITTTEDWNGTNWSEGVALPQILGYGVGFGAYDSGIVVGWSGTETFCWNGSSWSDVATRSIQRYNTHGGFGTSNDGLIAGGRSPNVDSPGFTDCVELYDGTAWSSGPNLPTARECLASADSLNTGTDNGMIAGGYQHSPSSYLAETLEYSTNIASASFHKIAAGQILGDGSEFSSSLQAQLLTSVGSIKTYISGSFNHGFTTTGDIKTAIAGVWSEVNPLNQARAGGVVGSKYSALAVGGRPPGGHPYMSTCTELWNGTNWSVATARNNLAAGRNIAGNSEAAISNQVPTHIGYNEIWNGNSWAEASNVNTHGFSGKQMAGNVDAAVEAGGFNGSSQIQDDVAEWNGSTAVWSEATNMPTNRGGGAMFGTQNDAMYAGGAAPTITNGTILYDGTNWSAGVSLPVAGYRHAGDGSTNSAISAGSHPASPGAWPQYNAFELDEVTWHQVGNLSRAPAGAFDMDIAGDPRGALAAGGYVVNNTEEYSYDTVHSSGSFGQLRSNTSGEIRTDMLNLSGSTFKLPLLSDYQINFQDYQPQEGTGSYSGSHFRGTSIRSADVNILDRPGNFFFHSDYNALGFTYMSASIYSQSIDFVTCSHQSASYYTASRGFITQSHYCYKNVVCYITGSYV